MSKRECDVFISYSSKEMDEASMVEAVLEKNGIACWMAPQSIPGGSNYAKEIPVAIKQCKVFLLILSEQAQNSIWVLKELDKAINEKKLILPLMIEDCILIDEFDFFLTGAQRYEAFKRKEEVLKELVVRIKAIVGINKGVVSGDGTHTKEESTESAKHLFRKGHDLYVEGRFEEAIKWYKLAAEQGDVLAQSSLGVCYANGRGVSEDYEEAVKWYKRAASQGYDIAQYNIGFCYYGGRGVEQDYEEAVRWWEMAAEQGDTDAQYALGRCYLNGKGVNVDCEKAVKWWKKAAEQGMAVAQHDLGVSYANGRGVNEDFEEAIKWLARAARQGYEEAKQKVKILRERIENNEE